MIELPDGKTESDTSRNGAFSYSGEWHAFAIGAACGFVAILPVPRLARFVYSVVGLEEPSRSAAIKEAKAESWYALGGVLFGATWGVFLLGVVALALASI